MSVTSNRKVTISLTGDVEFTQEFDAAASVLGSGQNQLVNLSTGNNTIIVPSSAVAVTVIPPSDNEETLTLKGVDGDTGIALSETDPCSLSLSGVNSFVIAAGGTVTGLRLIYS